MFEHKNYCFLVAVNATFTCRDGVMSDKAPLRSPIANHIYLSVQSAVNARNANEKGIETI
jgi:hypothetical protein